MEKLQEKDNGITFKAKIEDSLANAIRRYFGKVPVLAIDEVEIFKNDSALYDETIAHRVGLVPIKMEKSAGEKTTGELKLSVKKEGIVNSEELKGNMDVAFGKIPITLLDKGQELELVASVRAGKGIEHAKFSPGLMFYRNVAEVTVEKEFLEDIKNICPNCKISEKGNKLVIVDEGVKEVADVIEGLCDEKGKKAEVDIKEDLVISLESFGQLDSRDIFKKSVEQLKKDLEEVSKNVK